MASEKEPGEAAYEALSKAMTPRFGTPMSWSRVGPVERACWAEMERAITNEALRRAAEVLRKGRTVIDLGHGGGVTRGLQWDPNGAAEAVLALIPRAALAAMEAGDGK